MEPEPASGDQERADPVGRRQQLLRAIMASRLAPRAMLWERSQRAPRQALAELGRHDLLDAPRAHRHAFRNALLLDLPRVLSTRLALAVASQLSVIEAVRCQEQSDSQRELINALCAGRSIAAFAIDSPIDSAIDSAIGSPAKGQPSGQSTGAGLLVERDAESWAISGRTRPVHGLVGADLLLVSAGSPDGPGVLAIIDLDAESVCIEPAPGGAAGSTGGRAVACLEQVGLPPEAVLAGPQRFHEAVQSLQQLHQQLVAAALIGCASTCVALAMRQLKEEPSRPRPGRLASLASGTEAARRLIETSHPGAGDGPPLASMALLLADELATSSARLCLELVDDPLAAYGRPELCFLSSLVTRAFTQESPARLSDIVLHGLETAESLDDPDPRLQPEAGIETERVETDGAGSQSPDAGAAIQLSRPAATGRVEEKPSTVGELLSTLPSRARPGRLEGWSSTFHFLLKGADQPEWTIRIDSGTCSVSQGLEDAPDCVVRMSERTFLGISSGTVNPQVAFMMRKIKVSDLGQMMRFIKAFRFGGRT